jgi:predicted nucleic acid-binding protein
MASRFIDSSALVKRYRIEQGSRQFSYLLQQSDPILISRLTAVEVSAAIVRRSKQSHAPSEELESTIALLDADVRDLFQIIELDDAIFESALEMTRKHALRGADAVHLACALAAQAEFAPHVGFYLVSADDELNAAAIAEGLQVENPNLQP